MMESQNGAYSRRRRYALALLLIILPILVFYSILSAQAFSIPMGDDIAALDFGTSYEAAPGFLAKLGLVLFSQHNEYKLILLNSFLAANLTLLHRLDFIALCHIGNLFMLPVFTAIAFCWRRPGMALPERLLRLAPVALLLFQLQYWETLDWVMSGLQDLPILVFALYAIALCTRRFAGSGPLLSLCVVLGMFTSGNGFCVVPICAWMLYRERRVRDLLILIGSTVLAVALYAHRYTINSQQVGLPTQSILHKIAYFLSFNGAIVGIPWSNVPGVVCGAVFLTMFVVAFCRGYECRNPAIFYSMVFIVATALLTTAGRSNFPISQSWSFRYRVYSTLWMVFLYIFLSEELQRTGSRYFKKFLPVAITFSIVFCVGGDLLGFYYLRQRRINTNNAMLQWERSQCGLAPLPIILRKYYLPPEGDLMLPSIRARVYDPPILDPCYHPYKR
jgi:hypothetical protein